jgi:hypothetical protein
MESSTLSPEVRAAIKMFVQEHPELLELESILRKTVARVQETLAATGHEMTRPPNSEAELLSRLKLMEPILLDLMREVTSLQSKLH